MNDETKTPPAPVRSGRWLVCDGEGRARVRIDHVVVVKLEPGYEVTAAVLIQDRVTIGLVGGHVVKLDTSNGPEYMRRIEAAIAEWESGKE